MPMDCYVPVKPREIRTPIPYNNRPLAYGREVRLSLLREAVVRVHAPGVVLLVRFPRVVGASVRSSTEIIGDVFVFYMDVLKGTGIERKIVGGRGDHRSFQGGLVFSVNIYSVSRKARLFCYPFLRTARCAEVPADIDSAAVLAAAVPGAQAQAVRTLSASILQRLYKDVPTHV